MSFTERKRIQTYNDDVEHVVGDVRVCVCLAFGRCGQGGERSGSGVEGRDDLVDGRGHSGIAELFRF